MAVGIGGARPGSASAALGNAVVLRMNNMEYLQAGHRRTRHGVGRPQLHIPAALTYICLYARYGSPVTTPRPARSIPRIADQRLAGPEQNHEQNTDDAE